MAFGSRFKKFVSNATNWVQNAAESVADAMQAAGTWVDEAAHSVQEWAQGPAADWINGAIDTVTDGYNEHVGPELHNFATNFVGLFQGNPWGAANAFDDHRVPMPGVTSHGVHVTSDADTFLSHDHDWTMV